MQIICGERGTFCIIRVSRDPKGVGRINLPKQKLDFKLQSPDRIRSDLEGERKREDLGRG